MKMALNETEGFDKSKGLLLSYIGILFSARQTCSSYVPLMPIISDDSRDIGPPDRDDE